MLSTKEERYESVVLNSCIRSGMAGAKIEDVNGLWRSSANRLRKA